MPTTLPRHILLLPLLFLLGFLYPWQVQHHARHSIYAQGGVAEAARPATKGQNDATQQLTSTLIGAAAGGGTGATTALQGEKYNRQLHQMEIDWINKNAAAFAAQHPGMSVQQARALLTRAALGLVDNSTAHGNSRLIRRGVIDGQTYRNAQNFIKGHAVGATYHEGYDDQPQRGAHSMFTATEYEKSHHYYNPNTAHGGLIDNSLDFIPVGRGINNVVKGLKGLKGGKGAEIPKISNIYSPKIRKQMQKRGWTEQEIQEAIKTRGIPAVGKKGPATRYVHPVTGKSIVVDNKTGEVFHVGGGRI